MTVPVYALTEKAKLAIADLIKDYRIKLGFADFAKPPRGYYGQLSDEFQRKMREIVTQGLRQVENDRTVRVKCPQCGRIELVAGDVQRWSCVCSPNTERYPFETSWEDS